MTTTQKIIAIGVVILVAGILLLCFNWSNWLGHEQPKQRVSSAAELREKTAKVDGLFNEALDQYIKAINEVHRSVVTSKKVADEAAKTAKQASDIAARASRRAGDAVMLTAGAKKAAHEMVNSLRRVAEGR